MRIAGNAFVDARIALPDSRYVQIPGRADEHARRARLWVHHVELVPIEVACGANRYNSPLVSLYLGSQIRAMLTSQDRTGARKLDGISTYILILSIRAARTQIKSAPFELTK